MGKNDFNKLDLRLEKIKLSIIEQFSQPLLYFNNDTKISILRKKIDFFLNLDTSKYKNLNDVFKFKNELFNETEANDFSDDIDQGICAGFDPVLTEDGKWIIKIRGDLVNNVCSNGMDFTGYSVIKHNIKKGINKKDVKEIILDIQTNGGSVDGIFDLWQYIVNQSEIKQINAWVNSHCYSAGLLIASACNKIIATNREAKIGSLGVVVSFLDFTKNLASQGIEEKTYTSTKATEKRLDLNTEEGKNKLVKILDDIHDDFEKKVIFRNRVKDINKVNNGDIFKGEEALLLGLFDEVWNLTNNEYEKLTILNKQENKKMTNNEDIIALERERVKLLTDKIVEFRDNKEVISLIQYAIHSDKSWEDIEANVNKKIEDQKKLVSDFDSKLKDAIENKNKYFIDVLNLSSKYNFSIEEFRKVIIYSINNNLNIEDTEIALQKLLASNPSLMATLKQKEETLGLNPIDEGFSSWEEELKKGKEELGIKS